MMIVLLKYINANDADKRLSLKGSHFNTHSWAHIDAPRCGEPLSEKDFVRYQDFLDQNIVPGQDNQIILLEFGCGGLPDPYILFNRYVNPLAERQEKFVMYILAGYGMDPD